MERRDQGMDKVSIIIPTFNRAAYITKCIDSALAQDYPNVEVIVSDNASADNTEETVKKYSGDGRVRYFRNAENIGMTPNWRKALYERSTGDWAIILGDDDYLLSPTFVSKAMALVKKDAAVVFVHANIRILHQDTGAYTDTDKKLPEIVEGKWMFLNYKYAVRGTVNFDLLTVIFRKDLAVKINIFSDTISSSDRESLLKLALNGKVGFLDDVAAVYRIHGGNLTNALASDMNRYFDNMRAVTGPYQYAKDLNVFGKDELDAWKKRMITEYLEIQLVGSMMKRRGKAAFLKAFSKRLYAEYPGYLPVLLTLLKPKVLMKVAIRQIKGA